MGPMPSSPAAPSPASPFPDAPARLAQACGALWLATLSLMTAYMQQGAPAHRLLLARRIARNLETLSGQECYTAPSRAKFAQLARRWQARGAGEPATQAGGFLAASLRRALPWLP